MNPFYDLNKRLADIAAKGEPQALTESAKPDFLDMDKDGNRKESFKQAVKDREQEMDESTGDYSAKKARAGKDIGKPGKTFDKIAADAGKRYGSKAAGERVAGAVLNKLRKGVKEDGADLRDLSQFPTTPGGAAMGNPSIANQAAKARDMKEDSAPTEKVSDVIKRVMGDKLLWGRRISQLIKSPRANFDRYQILHIRVYDDFGPDELNPIPFSANEGQPLAKKLKRELIKAGYPVSSDLIIYPEAIMFNVRKPTTTAEAEMDEGNDFTGARLAAIKAGKNTFTVGGKTYRVTGDTSDEKMSEGRIDDLMDKRREAGKLAKPEKSGARFVAGKAYGGSAQKDEPEDDEEEVKSDQPKKRGRPAGTGRKIGAKGPTRRSKLAYGESADGMAPGAMAGDEGEYGNEGDMAKDQIHTIVRNARQMERILSNQEDLPEWVQAKLAKIEGMMTAVSEYIQTQHERDGEGIALDEKAVSVAQRRAAGIAHAAQKGEIPKSKLRGASKEMAKMPKGELHKFAATKEKSLPEKKAKKEVEETTTSGSVATSDSAPKGSKGGMQFGKGIYDSVNREVEQLITEGMNISVNMSTNDNGEPNKSVTVNADGADAEKLAQILKLAGLHSADSGEEACDTCGSSPCGCEEMVDENHPNWPTNTETSGNALQYSGGLNGPKSTGQTVNAPINDQPSRQGAMESKDLGMSLYRELQVYKKK